MGSGKASDASKKRKTAAENAAKESANYNWPDLADNGQVCFLVFQTRWCLS
jgi:ATP-dependent DNA helicase 2 subunit 1